MTTATTARATTAVHTRPAVVDAVRAATTVTQPPSTAPAPTTTCTSAALRSGSSRVRSAAAARSEPAPARASTRSCDTSGRAARTATATTIAAATAATATTATRVSTCPPRRSPRVGLPVGGIGGQVADGAGGRRDDLHRADPVAVHLEHLELPAVVGEAVTGLRHPAELRHHEAGERLVVAGGDLEPAGVRDLVG